MLDTDQYHILSSADVAFVLDGAIGGKPVCLYWGPRVADVSPDQMKQLSTRQRVHGGADVAIEPSVFHELGSGFASHPGIAAHRNGLDWASQLRIDRVTRTTDDTIVLHCRDDRTGLLATYSVSLHPFSQTLSFQTTLSNAGEDFVSLDQCAAATLPLDARAERAFGFSGRWAGEFQLEEIPSFTGSYVRENRSGRTSHHSFPGLILAANGTTEHTGLCWGFHLGWSGNHRLNLERTASGHSFVQMGELLLPGEISLAPGESYQSPVLYAAVSQAGFSGLSQRFHSHVRNTVMDGRIKRKPRPIHYNTWEAVYFDHDLQTLKSLADKAAQVGVERFILDDGWFGSRRNDQSGLGDWVVSPDVYPDGLAPLIDHVQDLDMEFGLWFEPEMVNPDSDLFRAHPDWVLQVDGVEHIPFRNQYVLDLTRDEVSNYLFERLDALLSEYAIAYVKWDMNRDIHHPGSNGRPAAHAQTRAVYALMDRLRAAHPNVEIESCASGGGRADYGVLQRTDRIWTSDSNDALDRQRIQSGATHFFPLEILGAHVGPRTCHITGRKLSMSLRVATAFFGHMGLELNLLKESERDLGTLAAGIALHKVYRDVLHAGDFFRLDTPDHVNAVSVVAQDQCQALLSWCQLTGHRETEPGRVYFVGLDPERRYTTRIIWPNPVRSQTAPSILETADLTGDGTIFSGAALMQIGLQLPLLLPETCLIFDLTAVDHSD